jgi:hypothetical protein
MRLPLARTTYVLSGNGHSSANHGSPEQFRTLHDEEGNARIVHTVIQFRQTEDSIGRPVSQIIEHVMGGHACSMERYFLGGAATDEPLHEGVLCASSPGFHRHGVVATLSWRRVF